MYGDCDDGGRDHGDLALVLQHGAEERASERRHVARACVCRRASEQPNECACDVALASMHHVCLIDCVLLG